MAERERKRALIWLTNTKGMGIKTLKKFMEAEVDFEELYVSFPKFKSKIEALFGQDLCGKLEFNRDDTLIDQILREMQKKKVDIIPYFDKNYPEGLKEIYNPPVMLYTIGDKSLLGTVSLGVVGSRSVTRYGREVTRTFSESIAKAGVTIVSGLARGADSIAHRAALDVGGKTVAVLGSGIDICYPPENFALYEEIAEKGLIVSEYPIGTRPNNYQFPERNRIICGLSNGVLVTEAGEKSGSLITAEYAIEQGRALYVVPGNITSKMSAGSNRYLKTLQGAIVTEPEDILKEFGIETTEQVETKEVQLDFSELKVYEYLKTKDASVDELIDALQMEIQELNNVLFLLEMKGLVKAVGTNLYGV